MAQRERIILGIDPGTIVMGYAVLHVCGSKVEALELNVVKLDKMAEHADRLKKIFDSIIDVVEKHKPDELAIEAPFFGKNVQSMLKLGRAQGVAIAAALSRQIPVVEYSPKKIKMSITGNGNASKEQVAAMLKQTLNLKDEKYPLDATDALGAALCHYYQNAKPDKGKRSFSGWKAFLNENPGRKM